MPLDQVTTAVKAGQLPAADSFIAIICQSGRRSAQAAVKLTKVHGYTNVVNVQGGAQPVLRAVHPRWDTLHRVCPSYLIVSQVAS